MKKILIAFLISFLTISLFAGGSSEKPAIEIKNVITMAIPVALCDLSIKLTWAIKHHFYHKRPLAECIPSKRHDDLRIMLIIGDGTLCLMDGADAAVRSGGIWVPFFLRLNIVAWC